MTIRVLDSAYTKLLATSTRPINLIRWEHSGILELLSCSGPIVFNSEAYTEGGARIQSIQDGRSATLSTPATTARIAEVVSGNWRNGICQIYAIPGLPGDGLTYTLSEAVLQLDGMIVSSRFSGDDITLSILHKYSKGYTPPNLISEVCHHIPPAGTIISYNGDQMVLEARR